MVQNVSRLLFLGALAVSLWGGAAFAQENSLDQSADQDQGQYQPMDMGYAGFGSIGMMQSAWLDPLQNLGEGQSKPAYSKYYWSPDLVLPIRVREGMITMLNFPSWEMVEDVFIGDNSTFDGQISGPNTVLLYPKKGANVGVDTNIIIFGRSGNRYVFYVRSEGVNTERLTNAIIDIDIVGGDDDNSSAGAAYGGGRASGGNNLGFSGGNSKSVASTYTKRFQKENWMKTLPVDPEKFRFDIEVYIPNPDDIVIAPERVWRDDIFTYIDLGAKALNMSQRPIVTLINEKVETPVGFRSKGPNNRLIVVEAVGDMVLRNGKRIVCLKMRRSDSAGLEHAIYADNEVPGWDVPPALKNGDIEGAFSPSNGMTGSGGDSGYLSLRGEGANGAGNGAMMNGAAGGAYPGNGYQNGANPGMPGGNAPAQFDVNVGGGEFIIPQYGQGSNNGFGINYMPGQDAASRYDYSKMQRLPNQSAANIANGNSKYLQQYGYGSGFADANTNISIELGTDSDVDKLETLWDQLNRKYARDLSSYEPFYSVDASADGQGKELFHLRVGPVKTLEEGDNVCSKLGRNGIFCSVVRTQ